MHVGVTSIFAHRPAVFYAQYLSHLARGLGHTVSQLVCPGALDHCHSLDSKGTPRWRECAMCRLGSIASFPDSKPYYVRRERQATHLDEETVFALASSSVYSIERVETDAHRDSAETRARIASFSPSIRTIYQNTLDWIENARLDFLLCYNGRMDATRAVIAAAAEKGVPFATFERPIYGYGILIIPGSDCLSLTEVRRANLRFRDAPLTAEQAQIAGSLAAMRLSQHSPTEWRQYSSKDETARSFAKPPRVLILPSSRCEMLGSPHYTFAWGEFTNALDRLLEELKCPPQEVGLKLHPVWDEQIGRFGGTHIGQHYAAWCRQRGVTLLPTKGAASTNDYIREAELIVVSGSSAGIDAALLGKPVILLGEGFYEEAGIAYEVRHDREWSRLEQLRRHQPLLTRQRALRYLYTTTFRFPQFAFDAVPENFFYPTFYEPDCATLPRILRGEPLAMSDEAQGNSPEPELERLAGLRDGYEAAEIGRMAAELAERVGRSRGRARLDLRRKPLWRWIDQVRGWLPRGDMMGARPERKSAGR